MQSDRSTIVSLRGAVAVLAALRAVLSSAPTQAQAQCQIHCDQGPPDTIWVNNGQCEHGFGDYELCNNGEWQMQQSSDGCVDVIEYCSVCKNSQFC